MRPFIIVTYKKQFSTAFLFSFSRNADGGGIEARAGQRFYDLQIDTAHFRIFQAESGDAFREGYADLVDDFLALDPRPFVVIGVSPTVKGGGFTYGVTEKVVGGGVVPFQRKVAEEKKLPLVDCRAVLDPHMATAYSPDGLHPNASGNALLAAAFATRLRELESHAKSAEEESHAESAEGAE